MPTASKTFLAKYCSTIRCSVQNIWANGLRRRMENPKKTNAQQHPDFTANSAGPQLVVAGANRGAGGGKQGLEKLRWKP